MNTPRSEEPFIQLLTSHQSKLRAFIHALETDWHRAEDILQETNAVLWRKADEFTLGTNFKAWAFAIAHNQVRLSRLRLSRERQKFSDATFDQLAADAVEAFADLDDRRAALAGCFAKLSDAQRDLLTRRYTDNESVARIAASTDRPAGSIRQTLYRIRQQLADCINRTLRREGQS